MNVPTWIQYRLSSEMEYSSKAYGGFQSSHELYGVLVEELDEFFESVRANNPDSSELLQIAAVAIRRAIELEAPNSPINRRSKKPTAPLLNTGTEE